MRHARGFTLIELMIVIAIIAIIAAIAIPNLIEARMSSNEANAIGSLRAIHAAQALHYQKDPDGDGRNSYAANIDRLAGLVDPTLSTVVGTQPTFIKNYSQKSGYYFSVVNNDEVPGFDFQFMYTWGALARPVGWGKSGSRHFWIDHTGVIRFSTTQTITPSTVTGWTAIGG